jgi:hypothetical protein
LNDCSKKEAIALTVCLCPGTEPCFTRVAHEELRESAGAQHDHDAVLVSIVARVFQPGEPALILVALQDYT